MEIKYFGKLPIYADFLKFKANSNNFYALDQWFQQGIYLAKQKIKNTFENNFLKLSPKKFVFQSETSNGSVLGVFIPGRDKGGRKYPFIVFIELPKMGVAEMIDNIANINTSFLNEALIFLQSDFTGLDQTTFFDRFKDWTESIKKNSLNLAIDSGLSTSNLKLWQNLFGSFTDNRKYLVVKNLIDTLAPLKTCNISKSFPILEFPLSGKKDSFVTEINFWLSLVNKIIAEKNIKPTLLWSEDASHMCYLQVFIREPSQRDVLHLFPNDPPLEGTPYNMGKMRISKCDELVKALDPNISAILDQGSISLAKLIESI